MSEGWQVGDLALCLNNKPRRSKSTLEAGRIYRVCQVIIDDGDVGLNLEGVLPPTGCILSAYWATRFRKIKPDTEPCEEEFTVLIKRGRKVSA